MSQSNVWKLQDAKARLSELVRRARAGEPQQVTVHGEAAVVVVDPARFEVRPRENAGQRSMAELIEASRPYRDAAQGIAFDRPRYMDFPPPRVPGAGDDA
jgi:prevent-host-death family protein